MIKAFSKLYVDHGYSRQEADKLVSLFMDNPASGSYCRFSFGELQDKVKPTLDGMFMKLSDSDFHRARSVYTATELTFVDRLNRQSGEQRIERIKRDVATAVERTSRALADFLEIYEKEREIEEAYRALQSKRTQYRNQNVRGSMEKRFE